MNFNEALNALNNGQKIRLKHWSIKEYVYYNGSEFLAMPNKLPYNFLGSIRDQNLQWELIDDRPTFSELKYGDKFRWVENGPIMQKVYIHLGLCNGYINNSTYMVERTSEINGNNKVFKV